jgi:F-type H+-transporting ATPase subunit alpha
MKKVAGKIRLELAQFRELEAFMQFASDLDEDTKNRIDGGRKYVELLKQRQNEPMPFYKQVVSIYAANNGIFDGALPTSVVEMESKFLAFIGRDRADIFTTIETGRELTDEVVEKINKAIVDFKEANAQFYTVVKA